MRLLLLGGTQFVGRSVAEEGAARGWDVTTLNRGNHPPVPGTTLAAGDRRRSDGLREVENTKWDIVVDTWSWEPAVVLRSARLLESIAEHYVYISSRSVYQTPVPPGAAEDAPLVEGSAEDEVASDYARAKRGGELAVTSIFGDRAVLARAGLVLGPGENIGRLPWWLQRVAKGGVVPAPGPPDLSIQFIDTRDLAKFVLDAAVARRGGPFNLTSPADAITMGDVLQACLQATGSSATLHWLDPEQIAAAGVEPWTHLPIWLPPGELHDFLHRGDMSRATNAGLSCRPVLDTVADTWSWIASLGGSIPLRDDRAAVGLPAELESALLEARIG